MLRPLQPSLAILGSGRRVIRRRRIFCDQSMFASGAQSGSSRRHRPGPISNTPDESSRTSCARHNSAKRPIMPARSLSSCAMPIIDSTVSGNAGRIHQRRHQQEIDEKPAFLQKVARSRPTFLRVHEQVLAGHPHRHHLRGALVLPFVRAFGQLSRITGEARAILCEASARSATVSSSTSRAAPWPLARRTLRPGRPWSTPFTFSWPPYRSSGRTGRHSLRSASWCIRHSSHRPDAGLPGAGIPWQFAAHRADPWRGQHGRLDCGVRPVLRA